jgi:hypothetical protein
VVEAAEAGPGRELGAVRRPGEPAQALQAVVDAVAGQVQRPPELWAARPPGDEAQERRFRELTEEFVRARQAAGLRIGMGVRVFSAIGPVVEVTSAYPDLAALDQARQEGAEATRQVVRAVHELSRAPIQVRVFDVLVPFPS